MILLRKPIKGQNDLITKYSQFTPGLMGYQPFTSGNQFAATNQYNPNVALGTYGNEPTFGYSQQDLTGITDTPVNLNTTKENTQQQSTNVETPEVNIGGNVTGNTQNSGSTKFKDFANSGAGKEALSAGINIAGNFINSAIDNAGSDQRVNSLGMAIPQEQTKGQKAGKFMTNLATSAGTAALTSGGNPFAIGAAVLTSALTNAIKLRKQNKQAEEDKKEYNKKFTSALHGVSRQNDAARAQALLGRNGIHLKRKK